VLYLSGSWCVTRAGYCKRANDPSGFKKETIFFDKRSNS